MKKTNFAIFLAVAAALAAVFVASAPAEAAALAAAAKPHVIIAMGVVAVYGTGSRDPASLSAVAGIYAQAIPRALVSQIAVTNGDSIASTYRFGEIPSDSIIDPNSFLWTAALTGVADFDIGLRYPNGGAVISADCIVNGQTLAIATSVTLAAATGSGIATPANQIKRAWQLAGLTSNPGGNLEVYGTANAAATATGVANLILRYFKGA